MKKNEEIDSPKKTHESRGTTISIKFFLNKKLLPRENEQYPVYARVICKKQVCDFRIAPENYYTQNQLEEAIQFNAIQFNRDKKGDLSIHSRMLAFMMSMKESDVHDVLSLVHPHDRDDFTLAKLPKILKLMDRYAVDVYEGTVRKDLKDILTKQGYKELNQIIDWRIESGKIEVALEKLQERKKINSFKLSKSIQYLRFNSAVFLLIQFSSTKSKYPISDQQIDTLIEGGIAATIFDRLGKQAAVLTMKLAIEFAQKAIELSTKK